MSEKKARRVRKDVNVKLLVITVAVVLILCVCGGIFACHIINTSANKIIDENVYVNSIYVGGLTVEEAKAKIEQNITAEYFDRNITVSYMDDVYSLNLKDIVAVDARKTADKALSVQSNGKKHTVPFEFTVNYDGAKNSMLQHFLKSETKSNVFVFNEDYTVVDIDASKLSEIVDVDKTVEHIVVNAGKDIYNDVSCSVLKYGDNGFDEALYGRLSRNPVNASVGMNDDRSTYIIPEIVGISADKDEFLKLYASNNGVFKMSVVPTFPELTTEDLDIDFYQDVLGEYTSNYNGNLINRTKNVSLAADFVNGTVIMPGHTFSYNKVVGKRTAERGFREATVYTGEGTEEGLGGGICQVSSTIYCAQLRANLKTVSRTNHSYTVAYVPLGQDATVSYGSIDYVFENDTNYPIKIETRMGGGKLTVRILGTKIDKSATYDIVSITNSTTAKKEVQVEDPTLPAGETVVKQNGQSGAVVSTYKVYYTDGVEQKREYIGKSTYVPMNRIILVGTGTPAEITEPDELPVEDDLENPDNSENPNPDTDIINPEDDITPPDTEDITDLENGDDTESEVSEPATSDTGL